jgi:Type IV secretion system pilin
VRNFTSSINMKKILSAIGLSLLPIAARAQDLGGSLLQQTGVKNAGYKDVPIEVVIGTVISAALGIMGVIFLSLTVYGGYIWMIARGDESKTEKAKDTITNSVIGLAIVLGAYAITQYVVAAILKTTIK